MILQHIILHKAVIKRKYSIDVNIEEWITFCSVKHDFVTINDIEMSFFMRKPNRASQKYLFINEIFFRNNEKINSYKRDLFSQLRYKFFFMDDPIRRSYFTHV